MSAEEGKKAPDFTGATDGGGKLKLSDLRGKPVVLYFYPKDDTPGCTRQACSIRDSWGEFGEAGVTLFGVSPDTAERMGYSRSGGSRPPARRTTSARISTPAVCASVTAPPRISASRGRPRVPTR